MKIWLLSEENDSEFQNCIWMEIINTKKFLNITFRFRDNIYFDSTNFLIRLISLDWIEPRSELREWTE